MWTIDFIEGRRSPPIEPNAVEFSVKYITRLIIRGMNDFLDVLGLLKAHFSLQK